ncbi:hypothetical protein K503DRAFT_856261 [Rhizopogon vinicolor AM-OR11-026]|uniref:Uncharacterized protein n=1 Tax=Rhizopogon vinicolor AM-OR11-026 TaxID=1314800 RepID=A0A1B7N2K6_9AGAM|nr:hypothetical protein K503DRAFT_856261 [Rhizopogon vinicolor AM-OR11-026]
MPEAHNTYLWGPGVTIAPLGIIVSGCYWRLPETPAAMAVPTFRTAGKEIEKARKVCEYGVRVVAVSGDNRWAVTAGGDRLHGGLTAWEVEMGIVKTFHGHSQVGGSENATSQFAKLDGWLGKFEETANTSLQRKDVDVEVHERCEQYHWSGDPTLWYLENSKVAISGPSVNPVGSTASESSTVWLGKFEEIGLADSIVCRLIWILGHYQFIMKKDALQVFRMWSSKGLKYERLT